MSVQGTQEKHSNEIHTRKRIQEHVTKHDNTNWTIASWRKKHTTLFFFICVVEIRT